MNRSAILILVAVNSVLLGIACLRPARATDASIARSLAQATTRESKGVADRGKLLFKQLSCNTCHSTNGDDGLGPTMKGYFGSEVQYTDGSSERVDENHVKWAIINPNNKIMQGYGPTMPAIDYQKPPRSLQDVDDLVAYIMTIE
ncbi:MAG TPA: cytochrome c [Tepidisphaeraceae bacterium]|nr:cytochrome c [Tepidisphaeraceae bacterium]